MTSIKELYSRFGFWGLAEYSVLWILKKMHVLVSREILYSMNLEGVPEAKFSPSFHFLTQEEIDAFRSCGAQDKGIADRAKRLEYAAANPNKEKELLEATGIVRAGVPIAICILRHRYFGGGRFSFLPPLSANQCYACDVYTLPSYRCKGYSTMLYRNIAQHCKACGKKELLIFVASYNRASRRCAQKVGFVQKKQYLLWKVRKGHLHHTSLN